MADGAASVGSSGSVVDPGKPQDIKEAVLRYYLEYERTGDVAYHGRDSVIRRYESPALAEKLAGILDSVLGR